MIYESIEQYLIDNQEDLEFVCILCEGQHGNNTLCQQGE